MGTMTLERLLKHEVDNELLDVYNELHTRVIPATGAAHAYCRKVNKMIDAGKLCVREDSYRKVYLPTLAKAILKEMANRYANHCYYTKGPANSVTLDIKDAYNIADMLSQCFKHCDAMGTNPFGSRAASYYRLVDALHFAETGCTALTNRQYLERAGISTDIDTLMDKYSDDICAYCVDNIDKNLSPDNPACEGKWCEQAAEGWLNEEKDDDCND